MSALNTHCGLVKLTSWAHFAGSLLSTHYIHQSCRFSFGRRMEDAGCQLSHQIVSQELSCDYQYLAAHPLFSQTNQSLMQNRPWLISVVSSPHSSGGTSCVNPTARDDSCAVDILSATRSQLPSMGAALLVIARAIGRAVVAVRETRLIGNRRGPTRSVGTGVEATVGRPAGAAGALTT